MLTTGISHTGGEWILRSILEDPEKKQKIGKWTKRKKPSERKTSALKITTFELSYLPNCTFWFLLGQYHRLPLHWPSFTDTLSPGENSQMSDRSQITPSNSVKFFYLPAIAQGICWKLCRFNSAHDTVESTKTWRVSVDKISRRATREFSTMSASSSLTWFADSSPWSILC